VGSSFQTVRQFLISDPDQGPIAPEEKEALKEVEVLKRRIIKDC
jgi:hypothetical protein